MKRITGAATTDNETIREAENREISYKAALEGVVLLKNNNSTLPAKPGRIALYGAGASMTVKGGTGSGEVNERRCMSILDGMESAGYEISTKKWLADYSEEYKKALHAWKRGRFRPDLIKNIASPFQAPVGRAISDDDIAVPDCDTAVYVVSRQAGEGADKKIDKGEFDLFPEEKANIIHMAESYKNSVLVINSGSYMDLGDIDEKVSAIIYYCQLGMEGGRAFADLISGKVSPSGKLSDSWAKQYSDVPCGMEYSYLNGDTKHEYYREGIYVGYRYYDTFGVKPRFPFGFGLSYTSFDISGVSVETEREHITVSLSIKNTGSHAGKETVQVYVSAPEGRLEKEHQRLVAFSKTKELAAGDSEKIVLGFNAGDMASYSEDDTKWVLEKGDYIIRVGNSSRNTVPAAVLTLDKDTVISENRNICPVESPFTEIEPPVRIKEIIADSVVRLPLYSEDIETEVIDYCASRENTDEKAVKTVAALDIEEMAELCVGSGLGGMLKTTGIYAPGTVGRTTDRLTDKGIININLADGPAGLRLLRVSALNKKGRLRFAENNYMIGELANMPRFIRSAVEAGKKDRRLYQFTTSFPVGTALAQTWNTELCEKVGHAVSREMEEYLITFWLAPAMNIHRNPLCGRNFEYLSEDPLLTGKIAAAITKGVQSIPGNYATIKHFACNNCEDNRNRSDSIINERALREIYLRGFEICVKESDPAAVMTSYNKLNGVYTANSFDLCTAVLRREWGFNGLVMTDWLSTLKDLADPMKCIAAGNDLIMPGLGSDKRAIIRGVKSGRISIADLIRSSQRIADAICKSRVAAAGDKDK